MALMQEQELRPLAKDFKSILPQESQRLSDKELERLDQLRETLFATAEQPQLPSSHRAAACNALCSFLDQACHSWIPELRQICRTHAHWHRLLNLYLQRLEDPGAKPMKQVLTTLMKLLSRDTNDVEEASNGRFTDLARDATARCISLIHASDDSSCIKPSMMMLDALISKRRIEPYLLLSLSAEITVSGNASEQEATHSFENDVTTFVRTISGWARYADISLVAGRLLASLFSALHAMNAKSETTSSDEPAPLWAGPVLEFALESDTLLQITETCILPNLLRNDPAALGKLLKSLPFNELLCGHLEHIPDRDLRVCLLIVKVMESSSLTSGSGKNS